MAKSTRNVCFTLNNYTKKEHNYLIEKFEKVCDYFIIGEEVGESGTPHLQGYCEFKTSKKFETLKNYNERIHWETRKGSPEQAANYCKKDNKFYENGKISCQGKRSDLSEIKLQIDLGSNPAEISLQDENFSTWCRNYKAIEKYYLIKNNLSVKIIPTVTWLHGTTGTGKTRFVHNFREIFGCKMYTKDNTQWWDGYEFEEIILIDDISKEFNYRSLLRILDRYEYTGQSKGSYTRVNSKFIFITCDTHPKKLFDSIDENITNQVLRRLDFIFEVDHSWFNENLPSIEDKCNLIYQHVKK